MGVIFSAIPITFSRGSLRLPVGLITGQCSFPLFCVLVLRHERTAVAAKPHKGGGVGGQRLEPSYWEDTQTILLPFLCCHPPRYIFIYIHSVHDRAVKS